MVKTYRQQIEQDSGRVNPTLKLITDELSALNPKEDEEIELSDKASQIRELSKENNKLENQIEKLKWDVENEVKQTQKVQQQLNRLQKEYETTVLNKDSEIKSKEEQISQMNLQLKNNEDELLRNNEVNIEERDNLQNLINKEKQLNEKYEKASDEYSVFVSNL